MVDPLTSALVGFLGGLAVSPLLFVGYSALMSTAQAIDQDVSEDEDA